MERKRLTASASFLVFNIKVPFEHQINQLKTKNDKIMNASKTPYDLPGSCLQSGISAFSQSLPEQLKFR